jgi:xylan 1,4-beta-xylosidase
LKILLFIFLSVPIIVFSCSTTKISENRVKEFSNPILSGFYPDPSICRTDSNFYLVNSTFSYYPGIPVFQSKDLVNWRLIGYVLNRPEQLNLDNLGVSRGVFAPAIRYNQGTFYVTCTLVDKGGNFVVTSQSPAGPWSNPVWIPEINGIDPSLFFDENGKTYLIYNSIAPDNKPLYDGHRTIRMYEFDTKNLKVIGKERILINGGVDITKKPIWIEGPHIFQKNGLYFLIAAEGGTFDQHSEVVFRSKNIEGPYVPYEKNPILTQRHLDPTRKYAITSTGHADFTVTESGDWWAVFLGCRPYPPVEKNYYNTGRETFLAPVKWIDDWPVINPEFEEVQYHYPYPVQPQKDTNTTPYSGNFKIRDDFDSETLDLNWQYLRTPHEKWFDLSGKKGYLGIKLRPESCADSVNPSFLGHRQQHLRGSASVAINFSTKTENEKAGLLIFQNEKHFYFLCKSVDVKQPVVQLFKSAGSKNPGDKMELLISQKINNDQNDREIYLKIKAYDDTYSFFYGFKPAEWKLLKANADARFLSTRVGGGFVGCMYAMYATSRGEPTHNTAYYNWFEYKGNDEIYNLENSSPPRQESTK